MLFVFLRDEIADSLWSSVYSFANNEGETKYRLRDEKTDVRQTLNEFFRVDRSTCWTRTRSISTENTPPRDASPIRLGLNSIRRFRSVRDRRASGNPDSTCSLKLFHYNSNVRRISVQKETRTEYRNLGRIAWNLHAQQVLKFDRQISLRSR